MTPWTREGKVIADAVVRSVECRAQDGAVLPDVGIVLSLPEEQRTDIKRRLEAGERLYAVIADKGHKPRGGK